MKEKLKLTDTSDRKKIVYYLLDGKIGLFPTDTVYGICGRMDNINTVERIFTIKNREKEKPFLILCESIRSVREYAVLNLNSNKRAIMEKFWPGPLTIVFKSKDNIHKLVTAGRNTIAIRVPDVEELREIIKLTGVPLVAPSANLSGDKTPTELREINPEIIEAVDFIVEGECKIKKPSTIVDFSGEEIKILREGAIKFNL